MTDAEILEFIADFPELPTKPVGWTQVMTLHLNFGQEGGSGQYDIFAPEKRDTPIGYGYDSREGGKRGFYLQGDPTIYRWPELVAAWPAFIERMKGKS